jgi:succinate-acetate transporter protein
MSEYAFKGEAPGYNGNAMAHHVIAQATPPANNGIRTIANPGPVGLFGFACTTLLLSFINVKTHGVTHPNIVLGMALFFGGGVQLLAGMWEFVCGNTFGATAFSGYGAFWLSYAVIFIPSFNIAGAYTDDVELGHAVGLYLATWFIFTFIHTLAALSSSIALLSLFISLSTTFFLLTIGQFVTTTVVATAGGWFGILTAIIAYYCAASQLLTASHAPITLPLGDLSKKY